MPSKSPLQFLPTSKHPHLPIPKPDLEHQIASLVRSCPDLKSLRQTHAHLLRSPHLLSHPSSLPFALSKLLAFCATSRSLDFPYARKVFDQIPHANVFAWNSVIRCASRVSHLNKEFFWLYRDMVRLGFVWPNSFTLAFSLKACAGSSALWEGRQFHSHAFRSGLDSSPFVQCGLLNFYSKCEEIGNARLVFDGIPDRNIVAWSAMISGYARVGMVNEAFGMFRDMQETGVRPDEITMVSIISACARAGALDLGRWVHKFINRNEIRVDLKLNTALVDMYAKCGSIEKARKVFDGMDQKDTMAWSSMIVALVIHGLVEDAFELFERMKHAEVKPNQITFIGILSACALRGLVVDGKKYWFMMRDLGILPLMEHYGCMVDLLCRAGEIEEAYSFVKTMPISPNSVVWRTLLVGCKNHGILDKAEVVAEQLLEIEPFNAENYVLLSNMYALSSQWEKVSYLRKKMKDNGVKVVPGCSSIEIDGFVHEFVVGDETHPEITEIRKMVQDIADRVRHAGHLPRTSVVLHDVGQEEKEIALCEHSERLAIAFGLLKTKAPVVIRVVKNLRVCGDCHEVTKIISKVFGREIIVRDRVRFHRFIDGICSCKNFW